MPRLHPREAIVSSAQTDLRTVVFEWGQRHPDLTSAEWLKILLGVCSDEAQSLLKTEIRIERHGDANKLGGLAEG